MEVFVRNCPDFDLAQFIQRELKSAVCFKAATSYLTKRGLDQWAKYIRAILQRQGHVEVVHAADCRVTEPAAIRLLSNWALDFENNMKYRVNFEWSPFLPKFHPKMYICSVNCNSHLAVVGSSNWTEYGLSQNIEINTIIRGTANDDPIIQSLQIFESIINESQLKQPDGEWIRRYEQVYKATRSFSQASSLSRELQELITELESYQCQQPVRDLVTQCDYVVQAMLDLRSSNDDRYFHLKEINAQSLRLAKMAGGQYEWDTWHNSIRRVLNTNTVEPANGRQLFERKPNSLGWYRLSPNGLKYFSVSEQ